MDKHFWRDEAKLTIFSAEKRWLSYVKWILALLVPTGIGVTIYKVGQDPALIAAILAMLAFPVFLVVELFVKGGEAGNGLMGASPIQLSEAKRHVMKLHSWLLMTNAWPGQIEDLWCDIQQMSHELVGRNWIVAQPPDNSQREECITYLRTTAATYVHVLHSLLVPGPFNNNWRPPKWLLTIEREVDKLG